MPAVKRLLIPILLWIAGPLSLVMAFQPPTATERLQAIGATDALPEVLRRVFDPAGDFAPIPSPKPGDWLAVHKEAGQTFDQFLRSEPNQPDTKRRKLYLLPLGEFLPDRSPSLAALQEFAAAFFCLPVETLPVATLDTSQITSRINPYTSTRQLLTGDLLRLLRQRLPADAFCLLGITMEDLYPDPTWNFVFGEASLRERVGVYSFARYDPAFYGEPRDRDYQRILLRRCCKVLAHETGHMFGLAHCIYFHCLMNGSNHLAESDARPLRLCPVCLRKLHASVGFDPVDRYRNLRRFYQKVGFDDETCWLEKRLRWICPP